LKTTSRYLIENQIAVDSKLFAVRSRMEQECMFCLLKTEIHTDGLKKKIIKPIQNNTSKKNLWIPTKALILNIKIHTCNLWEKLRGIYCLGSGNEWIASWIKVWNMKGSKLQQNCEEYHVASSDNDYGGCCLLESPGEIPSKH
jgi:hypothetical protein